MFKRLNIVQKTRPSNGKPIFRDIFGFFMLGLLNNFLFGFLLCASKDIVAQFKANGCLASHGIVLSASTTLLAFIIPEMVLKFFSGKMPPFITARCATAAFLAAFGIVILTCTDSWPVAVIGICTIGYSNALKESTYLQFVAYYSRHTFKAWRYGLCLSKLCGCGVFAALYIFTNDYKVLFACLAVPFLEIVIFCCILKQSVVITCIVLQRQEDEENFSKMENELELWPPVTTDNQLEIWRNYRRTLILQSLIICLNIFNIIVVFENFHMDSKYVNTGYVYLFIFNSVGCALGEVIAFQYKTRHVWIFLIMQAAISVIFLVQTFVYNLMYECVFITLATLEGALMAYSCVCVFDQLVQQNSCHKYTNALVSSVQSLIASASSATVSALIVSFHLLACNLFLN